MTAPYQVERGHTPAPWQTGRFPRTPWEPRKTRLSPVTGNGHLGKKYFPGKPGHMGAGAPGGWGLHFPTLPILTYHLSLTISPRSSPYRNFNIAFTRGLNF